MPPSELKTESKGPYGLTPQPNGDLAVIINGVEFGRISGTKKAAFVLPGGKVLEAGTHTVNGRKVVVKDLELSFTSDSPVNKAQNDAARAELLSRVVVE